jgi:hypothetical protein
LTGGFDDTGRNAAYGNRRSETVLRRAGLYRDFVAFLEHDVGIAAARDSGAAARNRRVGGGEHGGAIPPEIESGTGHFEAQNIGEMTVPGIVARLVAVPSIILAMPKVPGPIPLLKSNCPT